MKKTYLKNQLEIVRNAFDASGASRYVSQETLFKALPSIVCYHHTAKKDQPGLTFTDFCVNMGEKIVAAKESPDVQLIRAKIDADIKDRGEPRELFSENTGNSLAISPEVQLITARIGAYQRRFTA